MNETETLAKHGEDISALKVEVVNLKDKVECLTSIDRAITRMTTLMEVQSQTINDIHCEIKETKSEIKETNKKVDILDKQITDNHIEDIKDKSEIKIGAIKRHSLNLLPLKEKVLYIAIIGFAIYVILDKTGLLTKLFSIQF